ncbi:hypothetical protein GTH10_19970, partial [Burkholderia thailandensis]|nr:hypothetical protein [Burkholderia thailandensis]
DKAAADALAAKAAADRAAAEEAAARAAADKEAAESLFKQAAAERSAAETAAARAASYKATAESLASSQAERNRALAEPGEPAAARETANGRLSLHVARPSQDEITLALGEHAVSLPPPQLSQLIEELAHARASMTIEQPTGLPNGWRFVTTRNPLMAVQKQANGDRLLVARHNGYGWVPFTFSPDVVIQLYMLLTQK